MTRSYLIISFSHVYFEQYLQYLKDKARFFHSVGDVTHDKYVFVMRISFSFPHLFHFYTSPPLFTSPSLFRISFTFSHLLHFFASHSVFIQLAGAASHSRFQYYGTLSRESPLEMLSPAQLLSPASEDGVSTYTSRAGRYFSSPTLIDSAFIFRDK